MTVAFFDTNVLIYAFTDDPRGETARALLERGGVVNLQSLNEFAAVGRRKLAMNWLEVRESIARIQQLCKVTEDADLAIHQRGIDIAERYQLGVFDSMLVAAALRAGCDTLFSEDMQDGLTVAGRLVIRNPFR